MLTQENLRETLKNFENQVAIEENGQSVTYAELLRQANQVSSYLLNRDYCPQSRIGICAREITDWVVCILGVIQARCVFVPLDASLPERRVAHIVQEANLVTILTSEVNLPLSEADAVSTVTLADLLEQIADEPVECPDYQEEDDLYIYFTSGSTGIPKGIIGKNSSLWHFIRWETNAFDIPSGYRFSQLISPYFDAFLRDIFVPLLSGGTICVPPREDDFFTPGNLCRWINAQRINLIHCVPSVFRVFNDEGLSAEDFADLQYVLLSGEKIVPVELNRWYETHGDRIQLVNLYGATETTMIRSCYRIQPEDVSKAKISIGQPIADTELVVLDKQNKPCRPLIAGDLYVVSRYLSKGYLNQPGLTAEKFVTLNLETPDARPAFKTGDQARLLPDGSVDLLGREDRLVKVRGIRIELDEIENVLVHSEWVKQAVVSYDEKAEKLVSFVIVEPGDHPANVSEPIEAYLRDHLPTYMIPSGIIIVDAFPLLSNGKVDYKTLIRNHQTKPIVSPANEIEKRVLNIWKEILKTDQISTDKRFHLAGGNSLSIMRLIPQIFTEFGVRVTLVELFTNLTIQKQAGLISNRLQIDRKTTPSEAQADESTSIPSRIEEAPPRAYYPLSSAQQRLYFLSEFENASTAYNIPQVVKMEGKLNIPALELALENLIARHESLRTAIEIIEEEAVQKIYNEVSFSIAHYEAADEAAARRIIGEFVRPFNLSRAPLLRVGLIKLADQVHLLVVDMHHIITDGVSHGVLIRDFMDLYHGKGLLPLRLQYKDYAVWQQNTGQKKPWARQRAFWKNEFKEEVSALELPTDFPRPAIKSYRGSSKQFSLSKSESQAIKALADQNGATLFMTLLSFYYLFLYKMSGQSDIVIGTTVAGRYDQDLEDIIGMFVHTLPLRNYPRGRLSFRELLAQVKSKTLECFTHQTYPYEELVREVHALRQTGRNPLFDVVFNLANYEQKELTLPGLDITAYDSEQTISKFDLTLTASEYEDQLHFDFEYCTNLFTSETIDRFITSFQSMVREVVADQDQKLSQINIVPEEEHCRIVEEFNATERPYSQEETIVTLFENQVKSHPDTLAVIYREQCLTYRELNERSDQVACYLLSRGVARGSIVGLLLERSVETIVAMLGVLKAGAAYLPIDTSLPEQRIKYMLEQSSATLLLSHRAYSKQYLAYLPTKDITACELYAGKVNTAKVDLKATDLAYCVFTSGSTGLPKGVMMGHQGVVNLVVGLQERVYKDYVKKPLRVALLASYSFDASVQQIAGALLQGHSLYIAEELDCKDGSRLIEFYNRHKIDVSDGTATHLRQLVYALDHGAALQTLNSWLLAGEVLPKALVNEFYQKQQDNQVQLYNFYGPTEACVNSTGYRVNADRLNDYASVPIGKPLPNERVYVADTYGKIVPIGVTGELCIAGHGLAQGYIENADWTAERFSEDWIEGEPRVYRTGDLARWLPDGNLEYKGRIDHQVKLRGYRIELEEVESVLLKFPSIKNSVVLMKELGGENLLVGYYVAEAALSAQTLRNYLSQQLPNYMIPTYFVHLAVMPLTSSGKVDRKAMPDPTFIPEAYVAPVSKTEEALVAIWGEVLQLDPADISTTANFFNLGGHSMRATVLVNKIAQQLQVRVSLKKIFQHQDIQRLSAFIDEQNVSVEARIEPAPPKDFYSLSSAQRRMYFLYEYAPESIAYNLPHVLKLEGALDRDRLSQSFKALIARYESLRTSFVLMDGEAVQRVHDKVTFTLEYYEAKESETQQIVREFIRPFDLSRAPLVRVGLLKQSARSHLMIVDLHHIISDGVSQGILIKDFMALYEGRTLPGVEFQYKDYAEWQREEPQQAKLEAQREFWRKEFEEEASTLNLPTDFTRPKVKHYQGDSVDFLLTKEETSKLKALGEQVGATLFMVILSAFNVLLSKLSNQEDITIGTPVAGRERADLEHIVGVFVNTLAIRNYPRGEMRFHEFLSEVKEKTLSCFDHQLFPFEHLIEEVGIVSDTSRNPLFDVAISFQNFEHEELVIPGLELKPYEEDVLNTTIFDLNLVVGELDDELQLSLTYSTDLFKRATIERFVAYFRQIITQVTQHTNITLSQIEVLSEQDRAKLLQQYASTKQTYDRHKTIVDLFEKQAHQHADRLAVVCGEAQLSYGQLNERANQLARSLQSYGVVTGSVVGLLLDRSVEMMVGVLGVLKAGAAYLPIDSSLPEARVSYMLNQSNATLLLSQSAYLEQYSPYLPVKDISSELLYQGSSANLGVALSDQDLAYCIFTSGSTGVPKGVLMPHRGVVNLVQGLQQSVYSAYADRPLRVALLASYAFDASVQQIAGALLQGHSLYIVNELDRKDGGRLLDFYNRHSIDVSDGTPTHLRLMVNALADEQGLQTLDSWLLAGEVLPKVLVDEFYQKQQGNPVQLYNFYGPTEACVDTTGYRVAAKCLDDYASIPIGKPLPNERVYIADERGGLVAEGVIGELCIAGDGLARGYVGDARLTEEKFIENWVEGQERVYRTGDLGRWLADGNIEYVGRKDEQVKIRGYRIELGEAESMMLGYGRVRQAVVVLRRSGEEAYLVGYYVAEEAIDDAELRKHLTNNLPEYMIPSYFVYLEEIPLTSSGKIDRKSLPHPEIRDIKEYIAPSNEVEEALVAIWGEVLAIDKAIISVNKSFFVIGGNSIQAIKLIVKINKHFNVDIKLVDLIEMNQVSQLANHIMVVKQVKTVANSFDEIVELKL